MRTQKRMTPDNYTIDDYMNMPYRMKITPDSDEGGYVISFPELPGCLTCGESLEEAVKNADDAKRAWLEAAIQDGIGIKRPEELDDFSGQFKLRLPKSLHRELAMNDQREGISMNQYCVYLLAKKQRAICCHLAVTLQCQSLHKILTCGDLGYINISAASDDVIVRHSGNR